MAADGQGAAAPGVVKRFGRGAVFLLVVSVVWVLALLVGHWLTSVELTPQDWQKFATARVVLQIVPALLLGGYVLGFVRGRTTPKLRLAFAGVLLALGVYASFGALRALVSGPMEVRGVVEQLQSKSWRDESGTEHSAASFVVRRPDGNDVSLAATGESLRRVERGGCTLGTIADIDYLPGLEVVFAARCQKPMPGP